MSVLGFYTIFNLMFISLILETNTKKVRFLNFVFNKIMFFIKNLITDNCKTIKNIYLYNFSFLFFFILISNIIGLISFNWTLSSWMSIIFYITLGFFLWINIIFLTRQTWMSLQVTQAIDNPIIIIPFLTLIETISFLSRVISLSVRLFANMLSGHALVKILISFAWVSLNKLQVIYIMLSATIIITITGLFFLEILVSILQAYVFILLTIIYLNEVLDHNGH